MPAKTKGAKPKRKTRRSGIPLMVYFQPEQATRLKDLSEKRRIPRANIVRFAVERLLDDINGGQMDLPLGLNNV